MSEASKRARAERRQTREEPSNPNEAPSEPTARLFGLFIEPGQGWRRVAVELPRSLVEQFAVEVSEPDVLQVTLGKLEESIEREAMQRSGVGR